MTQRFTILRITVVIIVWLLLPAEVSAAPITFNSAMPVAKGEFVNREQLVLTRSGKDPTEAKREVESNELVSVLAYGIKKDLALFGVVSYVDKNLSLPLTDAGSVKRSSQGFGDSSVFLRSTLYKNDRLGSTFRLAAFGGLKIPTGTDSETDALGRLPQPLQSGTGSWDAFGGIVTTYQSLKFELDAQLSYTARAQANDFEFGDELRLDASFQYRLWPRKSAETGVPGYLYGVLEANVVHRDKNTFQGRSDADSGGTTLFLVPGVQYAARRYVLEAALQIPIVRNLNGNALENDYVARAGFRWNF